MFAALILISIVIILLYLVVIKPFKYWEERDVKTGRVIPVFGDNYRVAFGLESFVEQTQRMYDAFPNDRYYGLYQFFNPALVIRTPDIIKKCCVKDFDHFLNRRNFAAEGADVLFSKNLLNLKGQSWKNMRSTLSPTFTGSKMKAMFELVCQNAKLFTDYFLEKNEDITEIELKDSVQRFTSDVIANAAFGIQVDSLKDRKNTFFMMGRDGLNFNNIRIKIAFILYQLSPKLASMFVVFLLLSVLMMLVYFVVIKPFQYWKKKNVKTGVVIPLFGDNFRVVFGLEGIIDQARRIYNSFPNERYYGLYQFSRPVLVIRNPDLIKKFCVKDFEYFFNRRDFATEEADILFSKYVLSLKGQIWRDTRSTLSPTFTSSKMKAMFMLICYNAKLFTDYFLEKEEDIIEVELKGILHRYTCGVMTSTLLGIQMNFMKDINHFFFKLGADFGSLRMKISSFLYQISPKIASILKVPIIAKYPQDIFINLVKDTIKTREKQNIKLPDFLGLLLDARKEKVRAKKQHGRNDSGAVIKEESEQKNSNCELTDVDITAQVFVYFLAGFEAVATQICLTILELAIHSDVQNRLIDEIDRNWPEDREPNYNEVINMPYLDMVVSESLRKWPNGILTDRIVTKEYTIQPELPGEKPVTLKEGTILMISILGLHNDPKYFPNPEKFDPERFSPENKSNIHPYTYIPFGIGPRNCIGSRFALLEIKALLFYLFRHFEVVPIEKTDIPPKFNKNAAGFIPINGFHVGFKRRR